MNEYHSTPNVTVGKQGDDLAPLAEFVVSMIQAFLRTGYYLSTHPEAHKAKEGLYGKFARLAGSGEITFLLTEHQGRDSIIIEGIHDKPLHLSELMLKGMADTYTLRFSQFLARKELVILSMSSRMTAVEFSRFIDLMSEPGHADMQGKAAKEQFLAALTEREISNISYVFREELISTRPGLPWRANLALSRLKKDLRTVPIFRRLRADELRKVRREILGDILRPLMAPEIVYAFIMNMDLATSAELTEEDGEQEVFFFLNDQILTPVARLFTSDVSGQQKKYADFAGQVKKTRILGKLTQRLYQSDHPEAKKRLEEMYSAGLIPLEELPPEIRETVLTVKLAEGFLAKRDAYLRRFNQTQDPLEYTRHLKIIGKIIPFLLEKGEIAEGVELAAMVHEHSREDSARSCIARKAMERLAAGPSARYAAGQFQHTAKEERIELGRLFAMLGESSIPHLIAIIQTTDDLWKRKQAAELLKEAGTHSAAVLIEAIENGGHSPEALATLIRALGELSAPEVRAKAVQAISAKISEQHPEVRRETLAALSILAAADFFDLFRGALTDGDMKIRKIALRGLALSGDGRALHYLSDQIVTGEKSGEPAGWELAAAAVEALAKLHDIAPACRQEIQRLLTGFAERSYPEGKWRVLFASHNELPAILAHSLAAALAHACGGEARALLARMAGHKDPAVARNIHELLRRLGGE